MRSIETRRISCETCKLAFGWQITNRVIEQVQYIQLFNSSQVFNDYFLYKGTSKNRLLFSVPLRFLVFHAANIRSPEQFQRDRIRFVSSV
jgi:hypothetical protein